MAPPMPPPFPVHSVRDFCYHQSQFMRDQYLHNPELLEYTVRAVLGPARTAGWTRSDIQEQFYQALQPPAMAAAATAAGSTTRNDPGGNQADRKSASDNDDAAVTLPVVTSPTRRTAMQSEPDSATTENAVTDTPEPPSRAAPQQLKTPSPGRLKNDKDKAVVPAMDSFQNHHDIDGSALKRDSQGRFKRPKGRPPKGYRWDDINGRWVDDGTSKAAPRSIKLRKNWKQQQPISALAAATTTTTTTSTPAFMRRDGERDGAQIWSGVYDLQVESPERTTQQDDHREYLPVDQSPPPKAAGIKDDQGRYKQPKGRPPKNCYWDATSGQWRPHPPLP
jgi:hypothetical protein